MIVEDYVRNARVTNIVDGDTLDVMIDLGFSVTIYRRLRVLGVNCPEMHGPSHEDGVKAKVATFRWVAQAGSLVQIKTPNDKSDSFGRVLAEVWSGQSSLSDYLLQGNFAVPYKG